MYILFTQWSRTTASFAHAATTRLTTWASATKGPVSAVARRCAPARTTCATRRPAWAPCRRWWRWPSPPSPASSSTKRRAGSRAASSKKQQLKFIFNQSRGMPSPKSHTYNPASIPERRTLTFKERLCRASSQNFLFLCRLIVSLFS